MNDILRRRRALLGAEESWQDVTSQYPLTAFIVSGGNAAITLSQNNTVMRAYTTTIGTYRNVVITNFTADPSYVYRVSCHVKPTSGEPRFTCRSAGGQIVPSTSSGAITAETNLSYKFNGNAEITQLTLWLTWSTSSAGDTTISNWKIERRRLVVSTSPSDASE